MLSRETQAFMEAAVDAVVVIDHCGIVLAVNQATQTLFGYRGEELLGVNVSLLMPAPDRDTHDRHLRRYLDTQEPRIVGIGRELVARRKDGSLFPARLSVGQLPGSDPPRFVGMLRDMSAEHATLADLKLQRDRANAYLELHESILLRLDPDYRIIEINARGAELLGAAGGCSHGRSWLDLIVGDVERERARFMLASASAGRRPCEREFDIRDFSGNARRILWRCIALRATDGAPAAWLVSGSDITEHLRRSQSASLAKERLTRVARLASMGEMASGVAHELNQPLTAITTYARACERYLDMEQPDFAELKEAVREINAEGLRAGRVIERLRQLLRNDEPAELLAQDVNALLEDLRALLVEDARDFGTRLHVDLAPDLPAVQADAAQLQQVVLNLVRNAFEALSSSATGDGEVRLASSLSDTGDVELTVRDNGPGFSPDIMARLFHPFATTKKHGTGLGLAMSRTIVQAHGGTIGVRALQPHGACVFVRLPAWEGGRR